MEEPDSNKRADTSHHCGQQSRANVRGISKAWQRGYE